MFGMGAQELGLILLIALLLFGAKRVPDVARSLGKAVRSFKEGMNGIEGTDDEEKLTDSTKKDA